MAAWTGYGASPAAGRTAGRQSLRPIAVGPKHWPLLASEDGGTWAAANSTLFQSCRLVGIDPMPYLKETLPDLHAGRDPMGLTPTAYAEKQRAA